MTDEVCITIRIQFEHDESRDAQEARQAAQDRVTSYLQGAGLYNMEDGMQLTDIENCGENW